MAGGQSGRDGGYSGLWDQSRPAHRTEWKIVGVIAGEDEMYADIVIAADGVNSFMAQRAGLIGQNIAKTVGVGSKSNRTASQTIEERFNLKAGEGAARMILGCTEGIHGGGFCIPIRTAYRWAVSSCPGSSAAQEISTRNIPGSGCIPLYYH